MRTPAVGLALLLGAALVGCSEQSAAPPPLPTVASPTAAPVPSPPAVAAEQSIEGAEAFVRFYFEALDDAYVRGDSSFLRRLAAPGCGGCDELAAAVDELTASGERLREGATEVVDIAVPPTDQGDVLVVLGITIGPTAYISADGTVTSTEPPVPRTAVEMRLIRGGTGWLVQGYRLGEP